VAGTSLAFHPNEMLYPAGSADGTIQLMGYKFQEQKGQVGGGIPRPYELPQSKAMIETIGHSDEPGGKTFSS